MCIVFSLSRLLAQFEWNGDWSDASAKWDENPAVAAQLGRTVTEDGAFWMPFDTFTSIFSTIDVCYRRARSAGGKAIEARRPWAVPECVSNFCQWYLLCNGLKNACNSDLTTINEKGEKVPWV